MNIILSACNGYPKPNIGGGNKIIFEIIQEIDLTKFNVKFLSKDADIDIDETFFVKENNEKIHSLPKRLLNKILLNKWIKKNYIQSRLINDYSEFSKKKFFHKKLSEYSDYKIFHAHDIKSLYFSLSNKEIPKVLTIHSKGSTLNELKFVLGKKNLSKNLINRFRKYEIEAFNSAAVVTFPSIAAKNYFFEDYPELKNEKKVDVVYNGINVEKIDSVKPAVLEKFGVTESYDLLLFNVANHIEAKRIDLLIEACYKLNHQHKINTLMINVSSFKMEKTDELKSLVKELNIERNVKFLYQLTNYDVISLMKCADYFIMPSEKVIFDIVILEALACGCSVIASNDGGNKEIIKNGENGILIEANSSEAIVNACLTNNKFGDAAKNTIKNFSAQKMVENYIKIYEKLIAKN